MSLATSSIEELIEEVKAGRMVVLMDDEDRENEGDLVMAASMVTPEHINFMARHARGLVCLTLTQARCDQLNLPMMVSNNKAQYQTNFTMSIEAAEGVTTGISAADRAHTIRTAVAPHAVPDDIVQPGHIFPIKAQPGGVLRRAGHTEAGCDLMRMAGLDPSAVIVEIMNEDGTMARRPDLEVFAKEHGLKLGTIADLIHYRRIHEATVKRLAEYDLETRYGAFKGVVYDDLVTGEQHIALVKGDLKAEDAIPMVRVHLASQLKDLLQLSFNDLESGDHWRLSNALAAIEADGCGVAVLIGRKVESSGLDQALKQFVKSQRTADESDHQASGEESSAAASYANIGTGAQILKDLGVSKMRVLSSKMRFSAISGFGLEIVDYIEHA